MRAAMTTRIPTQGTGPGRPREFDEEQVVARSMQLFWREGYAGTSLPMLLEETGIARGTLYRTFGDKRRLFGRAFERYLRNAHHELERTLDAAPSPLAGMRAVLESWRAKAHTADYAGCLLLNSVREFSGSEERELRAAALEGLAVIERRFLDTLRAAQRAGELSDGCAVEALAASLLGTACAVVTLGRPDARPDLVDGVVDTALRSLSA